MDVADDPMLLGWYSSGTGRFSPNVDCCSEEKPGWIVYAESRGGTITIDINDEQFVFIYRDNGTADD
jgi:hypothetical protein